MTWDRAEPVDPLTKHLRVARELWHHWMALEMKRDRLAVEGAEMTDLDGVIDRVDAQITEVEDLIAREDRREGTHRRVRRRAHGN